MTRKNILLSLLLILIAVACTRNPLDIDVSEVRISIDFDNVDHTLMYADREEVLQKHADWKADLTDIYSYQIGYCMGIGEVSDSAFWESIQLYRADTSIQKLEKHIQLAFGQKDAMEDQIVDGFKHLKYHFPSGKLPSDIVYLNSLFRSAVFCTENEIGIGLEMYLGDTTDVVQQLNPQVYFDWMKVAMRREFLERDVLMGWIATHYVEETSGNLAEHIVRWGKVVYLTEAAFPEMSPNRLLRYSEDDYNWALENELAFWKYLVDEKLLFKIDDRTTRNMMSEGPFTPGLPDQESPDRLGQFLGWRMVHRFMEKNDISLEELVQLSYNDILQAYEIE